MKYLLIAIAIFFTTFAEATISFTEVSKKLKNLIADVENKKISVSDALLLIDENDIDLLTKPSVVYSENMNVISEAKIASSGAAKGALCFDIKHLSELKNKYGSVIWVTNHINNDDLCYLKDFSGIFAIKEDPSSHAVIVTRVSNLPCLTIPQNAIIIDNYLEVNSKIYREGDFVTLDGFNGKLFQGSHSIHNEIEHELLNTIMDWCERYSNLSIHGNSDTSEESQSALDFGGKGVDPRTEHMFFHPERLHLFRKVILSRGENGSALQELEEYQRKDFVDLYKTMKSYPVKIRLLDPPLHEFMPTNPIIIDELAKDLEVSSESLNKLISELHEINPMMGNRGVRLLLTFPEILKMQARAIFNAANDPSLKQYDIKPWIVIPMIINDKEIIAVKRIIDQVKDEISKITNQTITYHLGVMMETPRACLLANEIAPHVDFISFGTNDLTGQTLAFSRGDVYNKFLKFYIDQNILPADPFTQLDPGVIALLKTTVEQIRNSGFNITIGICGEQASDRSGIFVCDQLGFDTVSCAPTRIPAVKLFAAQAAIKKAAP